MKSQNHTLTLVACGLTLLALPTAFAGHESVEVKFKSMDTNSDGRLSREEHIAGGKKMFAEVDTNRDGTLSAAEIEACAELKKDKSAAQNVRSVDQNNDGLVTKAEHDASCGSMFDKLDTNSDGYVSEGELSGGHAMKGHGTMKKDK